MQSFYVHLAPYNVTGPIKIGDKDSRYQELIGNKGDAENVQLRIITNLPTDEVAKYPTSPNGGLIVLTPGETSANRELAVEYVSHEGNAGPGSVIGLVQYAVQYY
ncbi:hypothetical protein BZG05_15900 [Salinivibrio kushneri]|nr:hypothetical protein BZG05_15900 [Salinivibrio kushneri]